MTSRQAGPQILVHADMSLALAEQLLRGVRDAAASEGMSVAAAVVDRGGPIVAVTRMDGTPNCGVPLAGHQDKSYAAASVRAAHLSESAQ